MTTPVGEIINLKDKLKQLLAEPTLDKSWALASSILVSAAIIKVFVVMLTPTTMIDYIWVSFMFAVAGFCSVVAFLYRNFDQTSRDADLKRKTDWANTRYLLEHRHLNATDILLDDVPSIQESIEHVKDLFENITLMLAEAIKVRAETNGTKETF